MDECGDFTSLFRQLRQSLLINQQRAILRLAGDQAWAIKALENSGLFESTDSFRVLSFVEPQHLKDESTARRNEWRLKHYPKALGQEYDVVILDAYEGFNLNAFAALSGVLPIGGVYILITPDDARWLDYADPEATRFLPEGYKASDVGKNFLSFFISKLNQGEATNSVFTIRSFQDSEKIAKKLESELSLKRPSEVSSSLQPQNTTALSPRYKTTDQKELAHQVSKLISTPHQSAKSGMLVCADRGRGKSAGIGRALAESVEKQAVNEMQIVVTGPSSNAVETLLKHCNDSLSSSSKHLKYQAPDAVLEQNHTIDILIVDEAAAIPVTMVQQLVSLASKSILATTIHGYEGTGRGFEYKLKPWLDSQIDGLEKLWLHQPIRWQTGDLLEKFINDSLCLENSHSSLASISDSSDITFVHENKRELVDSGRMSEIFSLLSEAHYQTSPNDLRSMLDSPAMEIFTLQCNASATGDKSRSNDQKTLTLATILVSLEGGDPFTSSPELLDGIWQGRRRPRGHLAPQSLSAHCGFRDAVNFRFARVVRIAVAPQLQSQGLGSFALQLLEHFFNNPHSQYDIDLLTTSFGCDQRLLSFWQAHDYQSVRLGLKKETATGEHSVLLMKSLKPACNRAVSLWNARFIEALAVEQKFKLRLISQALVRQLTTKVFEADDQAFAKEHEIQNKLDIEALAFHYRSVDSCYLAFYSYREILLRLNLKLCAGKYIKGVSNAELIKQHGLSGEKSLVAKLREEAKQLHAALN